MVMTSAVSWEEEEMILPQDKSIAANDCQRLLEKIKAGEVDEFDLKNEINAQWTKGYSHGKAEARREAAANQPLIETLVKTIERLRKETDNG